MQKFMKIVVAFLLVISIGLPSATTSSSAAEQWTAYPANTTGDVNKPWKVTFSDQVNSDSVSQQNVYVKRANGTNVDVEVVVNGATIMVTPKVPYTVGETYTLYLHSSIQSVNEQALPNTTFQFTVLSPLEIAKSVAQEAKIAAEAIKTGQPVFANPLAGTKDEITRANAFVADLEKAIATADEKVRAAKALIETAENAGATNAELAGAKANVKAAEDAIKIAKSAVLLAQEAIKTASVAAQLAVESVTVQTSSTVDVTLVSAPAYELTKADADKFRVVMDGTVLTVTDVVKSQTVNKRYTLSLLSNPLAGKQGDLTVNNTKAVIPNSEFGYDFKAPALVKVDVLDSRHLKLTFNENMGQPEITSYEIYKTATPNTKNKVTIAVLNADKTSVTLTIDAKSALEEGNYTLKTVGPVQDVAGNSVNTTVNFAAAKTQLTDTTSPSLVAAHYNVETGVLNVTFDEELKDLNVQLFSLGGVRISSESKVVPSNDKTQYQIQVANQLEINKIVTNPLKLTISSGAVEDLVGNRNVLTNFDLTVAIPPVVKEASYSEYTKLLRVIFDQVIDVKNVDPKKFTITLNGEDYPLTGGEVQVTANISTVDIKLTKEDSLEIEKLAGESETGKLAIALKAAKNTENPPVMNLDQKDISLIYIQDTGKPRVEKVTVTTVENRNNDKIEIQFTAPMEESTAKNLANYVFAHGNPSKVIPLSTGNAIAQISADRITVTITLKGIDLLTNTDYSLQVSNIMDETGEGLDPESRTGQVTGDLVAPTITSVTASASDTEDIVNVYFSEAVTEESAEKLENYTIKSPNGKDLPNLGIAPTLTYLETATEFKVEIRYAKTNPTLILESGGKVEVTAKNIADLAANKMVEHSQSGNVLDKVAPTIEKVQGKTVPGDLDEIIITFSENIDSASAKSSNTNYTLEVAGENVDLRNLKSKDIQVQDNVVTLKLDTNGAADYQADDYALKNNDTIKIIVEEIKDLNGNTMTRTTLQGTVDHKGNDITPGAFGTPTPRAVKTTEIEFVWNEELDEKSLQLVEFELKQDETVYPIEEVTLDATKKVVTLITALPFDYKNGLTLSIKSNPFTDLAGNPVLMQNFSGVSILKLGDPDKFKLTGSIIEGAPFKEYITLGNNQPISPVFQLAGGAIGKTDAFLIDALSFKVANNVDILPATFKLYWSVDNKSWEALSTSTPQYNSSNGMLKFTNLKKTIPSEKVAYFYVTANILYSGTVQVDLTDVTATTTTTGVEIPAITQVLGKEVTVNANSPRASFSRTISGEALGFEVKIDGNLPLVTGYSNTALTDGPQELYMNMFEIVNVQGKNTRANTGVIKSISYEVDTKTFTILAEQGLSTDEYIRLIGNRLKDAAGNPLAETVVAHWNGTMYINPNELNIDGNYTGNIIQNITGTTAYGPNTGLKKEIDGNVTIIGDDATGTITLRNLVVEGDLIIETPKASVIVDSSVTVTGSTTINDVSPGTFTNRGTLKNVTITDSNGTRFINDGTVENVTVAVNNPSAQVKLGGNLKKVNISSAANIIVESSAQEAMLNVMSNNVSIQVGANTTVDEINVGAGFIVEVTNNGTVKKFAGTGTVIEKGKPAEGYEEVIGGNIAVAALEKVSSVDKVEEVLTNYQKVFAINLADYAKLSSRYKTAVNQKLFDNRTSYKAVNEIKTAFESEVVTQKNQEILDTTVNSIPNTLTLSVGDIKLPEKEGYTIEVLKSTKTEIYSLTGEGKAFGKSTVTYKITRDGYSNTAEKVIEVTVTERATGIKGTASQERSGVAPVLGVKEVNRLTIQKDAEIKPGEILVTFSEGITPIEKKIALTENTTVSEIAQEIAEAFKGDLSGYDVTTGGAEVIFTAKEANADKNISITVKDNTIQTGIKGTFSEVTPGAAPTKGIQEINKLTISKGLEIKSGTILVTFKDDIIPVIKEIEITGSESSVFNIATAIANALKDELPNYEVTASGADVYFIAKEATADKTVTITVTDK